MLKIKGLLIAVDGRAELHNWIRFQGQYHDHETGLHYNRHRYYAPQSGRFISKDPIGLMGGERLSVRSCSNRMD
nr:RHS repeat-associated core domain-containing protein [Burkholderia sp. Bp9004]